MIDGFSVGQNYSETFRVDESTVQSFAELSGDRNPIHVDPQEARAYGFPRQVAHGALTVAFLSKMVGMKIPGPGAIWMKQSVEWVKPVFVGDEIELDVVVEKVSRSTGVLALRVRAKNQRGETVMDGTARVKAAERLSGQRTSKNGARRVALVTGGSRGLGAAIARRLSMADTEVAINYLSSDDKANQLVEEIRSEGGSAQPFQADVSNPDAVSDMVNRIIGAYGRLDVIVHGASPPVEPTNVCELRYEQIEPYLRTYVGGALALVEHVVPGMRERKFGRFVFIGTGYLFRMPTPVSLAPYLVAKQALLGLAGSMATELGPDGITTNMVSPGVTVTDFTSDVSPFNKEVEARKSPMRRLATVEDTADAVGFLASEAGGYVNGVNLPVTGGLM